MASACPGECVTTAQGNKVKWKRTLDGFADDGKKLFSILEGAQLDADFLHDNAVVLQRGDVALRLPSCDKSQPLLSSLLSTLVTGPRVLRWCIQVALVYCRWNKEAV